MNKKILINFSVVVLLVLSTSLIIAVGSAPIDDKFVEENTYQIEDRLITLGERQTIFEGGNTISRLYATKDDASFIVEDLEGNTERIKIKVGGKAKLPKGSVQLVSTTLKRGKGDEAKLVFISDFETVSSEEFGGDYYYCQLDSDKLVSTGFVDDQSYCSSKGEWMSQKNKGGACDEDSQCKSSNCGGGNCQPQGFKDWWRNLFNPPQPEPPNVNDFSLGFGGHQKSCCEQIEEKIAALNLSLNDSMNATMNETMNLTLNLQKDLDALKITHGLFDCGDDYVDDTPIVDDDLVDVSDTTFGGSITTTYIFPSGGTVDETTDIFGNTDTIWSFSDVTKTEYADGTTIINFGEDYTYITLPSGSVSQVVTNEFGVVTNFPVLTLGNLLGCFIPSSVIEDLQLLVVALNDSPGDFMIEQQIALLAEFIANLNCGCSIETQSLLSSSTGPQFLNSANSLLASLNNGCLT